MAKYQCGNGHVFMFPLVVTEHTATDVNLARMLKPEYQRLLLSDYTETVRHRCPIEGCTSENITEYVEPTEETQNVYIYDLTTGPQTELDKLLADGYVIKATYAKQYHLWKPKPKTAQPDPDSNEAILDDAKMMQHYKAVAKKMNEIGDQTLNEAKPNV